MLDGGFILAGIFIVPVLIVVIAFRLSGRKIEYAPLLWAALSFLVYVVLLKSRYVLPIPTFLESVPLIWFGKLASLTGTIVLLYALPRVSFRAAGLTLIQAQGSLPPVTITAIVTIVMASATSFLFTYSPNMTVENLLFQATLPGLDEELFMRGLLLLLLHQAFGKSWRIWGADTGWALVIVVAIFGLLHGVSSENGAIQISIGAIITTGFTGFILTWMRERTGSLLVPVLFHNAFNVAQALV